MATSFVRGIESSQFGGLCNRQHTRFRIVDVAALFDGICNFGRVDLAVCTAHCQQLGAVGKKFAGAAFVGFDVRRLVADDAVVRLAE